MKKILLIFFIISTTFVGKGQNLVPNGDFEQYIGCPNGLGQLDSALFWNNPSGLATPDYFNQCSGVSWVGVPHNNLGSQLARSGVAYGGIIPFQDSIAPDSNYREYLQTSLSSPLIANNCYHFEMYISLAEYAGYACGNLEVYFSNFPVSTIEYYPLPYTPQIVNTGICYDTINWTLISGDYIATGGESYLVIGNFKDDFSTWWDPLFYPYWTELIAYYYIDDVSLTPCTGISEQTQTEAITIYPNPVKDELFIKGYPLTGKTEIIITDVLGKQVYRNQYSISNFKFPVSNFKTGIYFIEINNGTNVIRKKFVKESVK